MDIGNHAKPFYSVEVAEQTKEEACEKLTQKLSNRMILEERCQRAL